MKSFRQILWSTMALTLTCLIVTALLAVTNEFTAPVIASQQNAKADESRRLVLPEADSFEAVALPADLLAEHHGVEVHRAKNGAGFAVTTRTPGYHGEITALWGVNAQGQITGVEILEHGETQGLGERITTPEFRAQFQGNEGPLAVVKGSASTEQEIEALTGATISSTAMVAAANGALELWELVREGWD